MFLNFNTVNQTELQVPEYIPSKGRVTKWDIIFLIISISSYLFDFVTDGYLAYRYYKDGESIYFMATLLLILIPALVMTVFTIRMYEQSQEKTKTSINQIIKQRTCYIAILIFQLALLVRYIDGLRYALISNKAIRSKNVHKQRKYFKLMIKEQSDCALLRVIESFLEAAPQLILQLGILFHNFDQQLSESFFPYQILSISTSFVSIALSIMSYNRMSRISLINKKDITWTGSILQFMWHFFITVSRVLCLSVVASNHSYYAVFAVLTHWILMILWLQSSTKDFYFCGENKLGNFLSYTVFGFVYIFTYIPLTDGKTKNKYITYYVILYAEIIFVTILWIVTKDKVTTFYLVIMSVNALSFFIGLLFMILYYTKYHPNIDYTTYTKKICTFRLCLSCFDFNCDNTIYTDPNIGKLI